MSVKKALVFDIIFILLSVFFTLGSAFFFTACGAKEDGTFMICHWAWIAVVSIAAVLAVQSVLRLFFKSSEAKRGISAAMLPLAVLAAIVPKTLINLCMMDNMHCHTMLRPFALVMGISIAVFSLVDIIAHSAALNKNNLRKPQ